MRERRHPFLYRNGIVDHGRLPWEPEDYSPDGTPIWVRDGFCPLDRETVYGFSRTFRIGQSAGVLSRCSHENIVKIFDYNTTEWGKLPHRIRTELAPWGDIEICDTQFPRPSFRQRVEWMIQLADAVDYLHTERKVVHSALLFDHILVAKKDGDQTHPYGLIKLTGFGRSQDIGKRAIVISPRHICPPEIFKNKIEYPHRNPIHAVMTVQPSLDIYEIGLLLLKYLFEKDIFHREFIKSEFWLRDKDAATAKYDAGIMDGSSIEEAVNATIRIPAQRHPKEERLPEWQGTAPPREPEGPEISFEIPEWWKELILDCCNINPESRPSAKEVRERLISEGRQRASDFPTPGQKTDG